MFFNAFINIHSETECTLSKFADNTKLCGAVKLREFKEGLGSALRHSIWILGDPVWRQELDSVIPVGPFQLGILYLNRYLACAKLHVISAV